MTYSCHLFVYYSTQRLPHFLASVPRVYFLMEPLPTSRIHHYHSPYTTFCPCRFAQTVILPGHSERVLRQPHCSLAVLNVILPLSAAFSHNYRDACLLAHLTVISRLLTLPLRIFIRHLPRYNAIRVFDIVQLPMAFVLRHPPFVAPCIQ